MVKSIRHNSLSQYPFKHFKPFTLFIPLKNYQLLEKTNSCLPPQPAFRFFTPFVSGVAVARKGIFVRIYAGCLIRLIDIVRRTGKYRYPFA